MPDSTLWISEEEVVRHIGLHEAVSALEKAFAAEATGGVSALPKTMLQLRGGGTLHSLGAAFDGVAGVKSWAHTPGGADPVLLLIDTLRGTLLAAVEAFALGQLRTAAAVAVATDRLASPNATKLAIIGTGKQALPQVAAVAAVRPVAEVRVFSPTSEHREAFAGRLEVELGLRAVTSGSAGEAVTGAHIVNLVTRATSPVFYDAMVEPGMHINSIGSIDLVRQEFDPSILSRMDVVATDSVDQASFHSSELRSFYGTDVGRWESVRSLADVVHSGFRRNRPGQLTLFKGMGSGVEDVALGALLLERLGADSRTTAVVRSGRRSPRLAVGRPTR